MALGYDEPRPTRQQYDLFLRTLYEQLSEKHNLLVYGSYARKTHVAGSSDIDSVLLVDEEAPFSKETWNNMKEAYKLAQDQVLPSRIPFQIDIQDRFMAKDGRMVSFDKFYKTNFKNEGVVVYGDCSMLNKYTFFDYKSKEVDSLAHNLRKLRDNYLCSEYIKTTNDSKFVDKFESALKGTIDNAKKVLLLKKDLNHYEKNNMISNINKSFPSLNHSCLEEALYLKNNNSNLDHIYQEKLFDEMSEQWFHFVKYTESLIVTYLKENPIRKELKEVIMG